MTPDQPINLLRRIRTILNKNMLSVCVLRTTCAEQGTLELISQIERAFYADAWPVENVCIDHCCSDIGMTEQLLDGAYVMVCFKQVGREAVSERVAANSFSDPAALCRFFHRSLQTALVHMMAPNRSRALVD